MIIFCQEVLPEICQYVLFTKIVFKLLLQNHLQTQAKSFLSHLFPSLHLSHLLPSPSPSTISLFPHPHNGIFVTLMHSLGFPLFFEKVGRGPGCWGIGRAPAVLGAHSWHCTQ